MKIYIYLLIVLFSFSNQAFCQSIEKLDEKYGFKGFKFGSPPDLTVSKKIEGKDKNQNITTYLYTGEELKQLYNAEIDLIKLLYFKSKLMKIFVQFKTPFLASEYKIVLSSLQQLFGEGIACTSDDPRLSTLNGRKWIGSKVEMELNHFYYEEKSDWYGYLVLESKSIEKLSLDDQF